MMHLVCRQNNMPLSMACIRQYQQKQNIKNFRKQLDNIGFCFDWSREVNTTIRNFINGHSGSFCSYLKVFITANKKAERIDISDRCI